MRGQRLHISMRGILMVFPTNDVNVFKEIKAEIRAKSNIITNLVRLQLWLPDSHIDDGLQVLDAEPRNRLT